MFTGLITDVGTLRSVSATPSGRRLTIDTSDDTEGLEIGASVACAGICLTVVEKGSGWFSAEASHETLAVTTLGNWRQGDRINLERAMRLGDELGGHLVAGHVDGVGQVLGSAADGDNLILRVGLNGSSAALAALIARKGSVAVDGVSLTINDVTPPDAVPQSFEVNLIAHTIAHTNLADLGAGAPVNIEVDMMARYAARRAAFGERKDKI